MSICIYHLVCYLKCVGQLPNWKSQLILFYLKSSKPLPASQLLHSLFPLSQHSSQILIRRDPWNLFPASLNVTSSEKPSQTFQSQATLSLVISYHITLHGRNCYNYRVYFLTYCWLLCSGAWTLESLTLRSLLDLQAWHVGSAQWGLLECKQAWMCISGICETLEHRPKDCVPIRPFAGVEAHMVLIHKRQINQLIIGWVV